MTHVRAFASALASVCATLAFAACTSSSSNTTPPAADSGAADARDPNANCVKPGTPNNEKGVGGYCETGSDCTGDAGLSICSGNFGAPANAWFCTRICKADDECGSGEYCAHDPRGVACVPLVCGTPDAGVGDAAGGDGANGGDAGDDGASDASADAGD